MLWPPSRKTVLAISADVCPTYAWTDLTIDRSNFEPSLFTAIQDIAIKSLFTWQHQLMQSSTSLHIRDLLQIIKPGFLACTILRSEWADFSLHQQRALQQLWSDGTHIIVNIPCIGPNFVLPWKVKWRTLWSLLLGGKSRSLSHALRHSSQDWIARTWDRISPKLHLAPTGVSQAQTCVSEKEQLLSPCWRWQAVFGPL